MSTTINNNNNNKTLGALIGKWQLLNFGYDLTPDYTLKEIADLEREIDRLESEGWRYEFKRENYTAYTVRTKEFYKGKCKFMGCINEYFTTQEEAFEWVKNAPTKKEGYTYNYEVCKVIRCRDIHRNYNIVTGEDYTTIQ